MNLNVEENNVKNKELEYIEKDNSLELSKEETSFFETTFGKIIDSGIDVGIRIIFPDLLEDEIIDIKNVIINEGFKSGIEETKESFNDVGKSIKGIFTGNFENLDQIDIAVKKGGLIDSVSKMVDTGLKIVTESDLLDKNISKVIKASKNVLLDSVTAKIEDGVKDQVRSIEKLKEHIEKWENAFNEKDFDKMKKTYTFVKKYSEQTMPIEELIAKSNEIENIQKLLENNGGNFEISETNLELSKVL